MHSFDLLNGFNSLVLLAANDSGKIFAILL